jgi:two-component system sensor histidine kinase/response regulator
MTKILVIEDEAMLCENILTWLTFEGYEAIGAGDGVEGVNAAILHQPDLIVCDINLPRLDGYGVLLDIQANSTTQTIPFIFLTARTEMADIRKGMQLGADDYLTKPFERADLLNTIQTRLERKAARDKNYLEQIEIFREALSHERSARLLQAKLVAMFSHDFRTPLTAILTSNRLLSEYGDRLDAQRRQTYVDQIEASAHKLVTMLDDMLLIAQMEAGKFEFSPESTDLARFIREIVGEFQIIYGQTHKIVYEARFAGPARVDLRLVGQIVSNLISNALKYSPSGSEVHVTLDDVERHYVLIVQDHGIGIPAADQEALFEAFKRGSNVGTLAGTGVGLATVKQAVEWHGGAITFVSKVGAGTTFTVVLPHTHPDASA